MLNALPQWRSIEGALSRFAIGIWDGAAPAARGDTFRILPDGSVDLAWELGTNRPRSIAFGSTTGPRDAALTEGARYFGLRFRPGVAHRLLDLGDLSTLTDSDAPLALRGDRDLAARLADAKTFAARVAIVESHLMRLAAQAEIPDLAETAAQAIAGRGGAVKIDALAARLGVTRRHLERVCRRDLGLSPKTLARILRFRRAAALLAHGRATSGADLAAACCYTDQAHLIREFQEFAGTTPKMFRA
jgi:AraC-like DNA-binding protein